MTAVSSLIPPIFVINLATEIEKRSRMQKQLEKLPVRHEFIEAICSDDLTARDLKRVYDEDKAKIYVGRRLARREIACYLSHLKAMRYICEENIPQAIILEDDVFISEDITFFFKHQDRFPKYWSIVQLGNAYNTGVCSSLYYREHRIRSNCSRPAHYRGPQTIYKKYRIGIPFPVSYGTQGYLVKKRFCECFLRKSGPIFTPIDHRLFDIFMSMSFFYALIGKQIIIHDSPSESSIEESRKRIEQSTAMNMIVSTMESQKNDSKWLYGKKKKISLLLNKVCLLLVQISNPSSKDMSKNRILPLRGQLSSLARLKFVWRIMLYTTIIRYFPYFKRLYKFEKG